MNDGKDSSSSSVRLSFRLLHEIMNSVSKRQKLSQGMSSRQFRKRYEDRITNLPSSLKTKILSCLPTKDAVKTSVLSRKWKRSWTSVTNLDFDDKLVGRGRDGDEEDIISREDFICFVNWVLMLRERSSLQRFHMKCRQHYNGPPVNTWIAAILLCHVQEIDLFVYLFPSLLTSDIFTCKTLVILKLDPEGGYINMPSSVCLPHLKTLHLSHLELSDEVSIRNLLSGCPVLEELNLRRCIGVDVCFVNIIAPVLLNLTLEHLPYEDNKSGGEYQGYEVVLDTPALEFLNLNDYAAKGYVVKSLKKLTKAVISVGDAENRYGPSEGFIQNGTKAITDFLKGISRVQSVVLSNETVQFIHRCEPALPIFSNSTYLELTTTADTGWCDLPKLLNNSPSLVTLNLHQEIYYDESYDDVAYFSADEVPSCFLSRLKVITINNFEGFEVEVEMVKYFLENAKVLEKLALYYTDNTRTDNDSPYYTGEVSGQIEKVYKELLMMKRGSKACRVVVL